MLLLKQRLYLKTFVKSVTGSHPAVIGVDLSGFSGRSPESVEKAKKDVGKIVSDTYDRGGVVTFAWHFSNPVSEGGFYLVWRNDRNSPTHYYAPFPGHASVPNFLRFYKDSHTLFENDLKKIYR